MMKVFVLVFLMSLALTPCFAVSPRDFMEAVSQKRDVMATFSSDCQNGIGALYRNQEFLDEENKRKCSDPVKVSEGHYEAVCGVTEAWTDSCSKAGGSSCDITLKLKGAFSGGPTGKYKLAFPFCVPTACKKGKNLEVLEDVFENSVCPRFNFEDCKLELKCKISSKAGVIVVGVLLGITVLGAAAVGAFFLWKRYYAANTPQDTASTGGFHEYSELAQYEEEEADIIADTSITHEGEEEHPIN